MNLIPKASLRLPDKEIERHATWLEIFFDLIFAVIVIQLSAKLMHDLNWHGILQTSLLFIPIMWTWASYTVFAARFDNNDIIHWIMTFAIMLAGVVMATQIGNALENGALGFSIGFIIGQFALYLLYLRAESERLIPKKIAHFYLYGFGPGLIFWIISLFFQAPLKFVFWAIGMFIYLIIPWVGKRSVLSKAPLHSIYIPERFGAFTIIILGQIIASVVFGVEYTHWSFYSALTSIMAFILAIIIFCQYYRLNQTANYKCSLSSGQPFIYTHIPLIIGLIIMGVCAEIIIRKPLTVDVNVNIFFCFASILYLLSFYLLQRITLTKFKMGRGLTICAIAILILIFFLHFLPLFSMMLCWLVIFAAIFALQIKRRI